MTTPSQRVEQIHARGLANLDELPPAMCIGPNDLALLLGVARSTVDLMRQNGEGPAWKTVQTRVVYPVQAVKQWLETPATPMQQVLAARDMQRTSQAMQLATTLANKRRKAA